MSANNAPYKINDLIFLCLALFIIIFGFETYVFYVALDVFGFVDVPELLLDKPWLRQGSLILDYASKSFPFIFIYTQIFVFLYLMYSPRLDLKRSCGFGVGVSLIAAINTYDLFLSYIDAYEGLFWAFARLTEGLIVGFFLWFLSTYFLDAPAKAKTSKKASARKAPTVKEDE